MRDFESYWAAGRAANDGLDPYGRAVWRYQRTIPGVVATRDELLPFVGPPYGLPLWRLLATIPYGAAVMVWAAVLGLSILTIAAGTLGLCGISPRDWRALLATLVLCAAFGPLTSGTGLGQVAIPATAAAIAGALLVTRRSVPLGLGTSALVAALQPNLAFVLGAVASRARLLPLALAALAATAIATLQPFGGLGNYLHVLGVHGDAERFIAIQATPTAVLRGLGFTAGAAVAGGRALGVVVVALTAWQFIAQRPGLVRRFAVLCAALPLALPFSHEHNFTIAFPAAIYALRFARGGSAALARVATMLVATDWLGLAQRPNGVGETVAFAVAGAFALAALAPSELAYRERPLGRASLARGAGLAIVPLVLLLGALTHPLPTWPDALSTTYQAEPSWSITRVWFDEQARSGIVALDPWWAALRALSIAGCALLWVAVSSATETRPRSATPQAPRPQRERSARASIPLAPAPEACPSPSRTP